MVVGILCAGVLFGGAFQLHDHQRQTVDKQDDVRAVVVAVFDIGVLIHHPKGVVCGRFVVHEAHKGGALLAAFGILHLNATLQVSHEHTVFLQQASALKIAQLTHRLGNGGGR